MPGHGRRSLNGKKVGCSRCGRCADEAIGGPLACIVCEREGGYARKRILADALALLAGNCAGGVLGSGETVEVSDMKTLTYTLPWPPSVNHYWRRVLIGGKPRTLLSKEGREFKQTAVGAVLQQRRGPSAPLSGRLAIAVTLFPPDRRRYDLDNRLKAVLDSLTEARVWEDDRHVKIIHLEEGGIVKGGACRVCIAPAPDRIALLSAYGEEED